MGTFKSVVTGGREPGRPRCKRDPGEGLLGPVWTNRACLKRWPQMGSDQPGEVPLLQAGACLPPRLPKGQAEETVTITCLC